MRAIIGLVLWLAVLFPGGAAAQERIELAGRPGITQPILFTAAASPVASVILFPGGSGVVAVTRQNFLLRVADRFTAQNINVAVADAPSDHATGMGVPFRISNGHATDITAIVSFLKSRSPVPVWLIGTSRGSISAANGAAHIGPPRVAGVVLTSSVWETACWTCRSVTSRCRSWWYTTTAMAVARARSTTLRARWHACSGPR